MKKSFRSWDKLIYIAVGWAVQLGVGHCRDDKRTTQI